MSEAKARALTREQIEAIREWSLQLNAAGVSDIFALCDMALDALAVDQHLESEMDKLLAMPQDRIDAALRLEGRDPKDVATIGKQAADLAILTVKLNDALAATVQEVPQGEMVPRELPQSVVDEIERLVRELDTYRGFHDAPYTLTGLVNFAIDQVALAATVQGREDEVWLVWAHEHQGYWPRSRCGYVPLEYAGRFTFEEAVEIVRQGNYGMGKIPEETMMPLSATPSAEEK